MFFETCAVSFGNETALGIRVGRSEGRIRRQKLNIHFPYMDKAEIDKRSDMGLLFLFIHKDEQAGAIQAGTVSEASIIAPASMV